MSSSQTSDDLAFLLRDCSLIMAKGGGAGVQIRGVQISKSEKNGGGVYFLRR